MDLTRSPPSSPSSLASTSSPLPPSSFSTPSPSPSLPSPHAFASLPSSPSPPPSRAHTPRNAPFRPPPNKMSTPGPQCDSDLLRLPAELLHQVLTDLGITDPTGLAAVAAACRDLRDFVYNNPDSALWRNILLCRYDDPRLAGGGHRAAEDVEWRTRVQDRTFLEKVFGGSKESVSGPVPSSFDFTGARNGFPGAGAGLGEKASDLGPHLDRICEALLDLYLDLPARDPSTEDTGPQSFFAAPLTRNGPFLNRTLRSEAFNKMYLEYLTKPAPSAAATVHDPVAVRTRSNSLTRPNGAVPSTSASTGTYTPPHALRLDPLLAGALKAPLCVTGNPTLARLHALVPAELSADVPIHRKHRGYLRELVYGRRHYRADNDYGPLNPDGTVDWHLVNALGTVMMLNAIDILAGGEESWRPAVAPMSNGVEAVRGLGFGNLSRPPELGEHEVWDWAGVAGLWYGSYAFLDYADWVYLNEPALRRRVAARELDLSRYLEAVGDLMEMTLEASHDPDAASAAYANMTDMTDGTRPVFASLDTPLPTSDMLPPVYFYGRSQQQNNLVQTPASFVRGVVRLTADDPPEVRWTMVIRYSGDDRWKVEGVQVGGRQSRRGFFGVWTDAGKEPHSPNGPIWYWKKEARAESVHAPNAVPAVTVPPAVAVATAQGLAAAGAQGLPASVNGNGGTAGNAAGNAAGDGAAATAADAQGAGGGAEEGTAMEIEADALNA